MNSSQQRTPQEKRRIRTAVEIGVVALGALFLRPCAEGIYHKIKGDQNNGALVTKTEPPPSGAIIKENCKPCPEGQSCQPDKLLAEPPFRLDCGDPKKKKTVVEYRLPNGTSIPIYVDKCSPTLPFTIGGVGQKAPNPFFGKCPANCEKKTVKLPPVAKLPPCPQDADKKVLADYQAALERYSRTLNRFSLRSKASCPDHSGTLDLSYRVLFDPAGKPSLASGVAICKMNGTIHSVDFTPSLALPPSSNAPTSCFNEMKTVSIIPDDIESPKVE